MSDPVRVAVVQMDIRIGEVDGNLRRVSELYCEAAGAGADLVVFPECAASGYCFGSADEARPHARTADQVAAALRVGGGHPLACVGFIEAADGRLYNSAVLLGGTLPIVYRKTHLPTLGVDRFLSKGDALPVHETRIGLVGTLICYDVRFPEAARVLALRGADVLLIPTNWPEGAESSPEYVVRARARENRVYCLAANRVGTERGRRFIGRSQIVSDTGAILAKAQDEETILYADIDPTTARAKRIVIEPGEWEQDTVGDRRPDLYGDLARAR